MSCIAQAFSNRPQRVLATVVAALPVPVIVFEGSEDEAVCVQHANEAAARLLSMSTEQLSGLESTVLRQKVPAELYAVITDALRDEGDRSKRFTYCGWQLHVQHLDIAGELDAQGRNSTRTRVLTFVQSVHNDTSGSGAVAGTDHESFRYSVSHDLRAPLRIVEGFANILKEDYGRLLDRVGNDHLDRVLGAVVRMNNMIDALLGLSQLSVQPLTRELVDLSQLARHVADDLHRQSPDRNATVHIEANLQAYGDPTLLQVVLENLLDNAWKYSAKRSDAQIWLECKPHAGQPVFTVRDNGAGFDMRFADRLFGAFQRLHSASDFPGTGVGLATVRRIINRHGGEIWAESQVEHGSSFHFTLLLGDSTASLIAATPDVATEPTHRGLRPQDISAKTSKAGRLC